MELAPERGLRNSQWPQDYRICNGIWLWKALQNTLSIDYVVTFRTELQFPLQIPCHSVNSCLPFHALVNHQQYPFQIINFVLPCNYAALPDQDSIPRQ